MPSYLTVLANRPINDIADVETLRRTQTGLARTLLPQDDRRRYRRFVRATIRSGRLSCGSRSIAGFIARTQNGVTFLTPALFRAAIPIPDNAPTGTYEVEVKLFADGTLISRATTAFEIVKVGFEQIVASRRARPRRSSTG